MAAKKTKNRRDTLRVPNEGYGIKARGSRQTYDAFFPLLPRAKIGAQALADTAGRPVQIIRFGKSGRSSIIDEIQPYYQVSRDMKRTQRDLWDRLFGAKKSSEPVYSVERMKRGSRSIVGTSNQGEITASYAALVRKFGEPDPGDGDKTIFHWEFLDSNGDVWTIYDYRNPPKNKTSPFRWNIGGFRHGDITNFKKHIQPRQASGKSKSKTKTSVKKTGRRSSRDLGSFLLGAGAGVGGLYIYQNRKQILGDPNQKRAYGSAARDVQPIKNCPVGTKIQSVIIDNQFFDRRDAVGWIRRHGFRATKVDATSNSFRFRQVEPDKFENGTFRTIRIRPGVDAVIGCPR